MAVFSLGGVFPPGLRQLIGELERRTSQVKASPGLLLEIWASALSYRSRSQEGRREGQCGGGPLAQDSWWQWPFSLA